MKVFLLMGMMRGRGRLKRRWWLYFSLQEVLTKYPTRVRDFFGEASHGGRML